MPAIAGVLEAAPHTDGWGVPRFLVSGDQGLGDRCPLDLIKGGPDDVRQVIRFARALED